ncbi:MAG: hypothetical protein J5762_04690 [Clostridia bacterium]|nr:hypothetical protein [Clostridia bacterium]
MKKLIALLLCIVAIVSLSLVGCTPSTEKPNTVDSTDEFDRDTKINTGKTTLFISNFNGAFGEKWLKAAAARYEEIHKDDVYEPGKQGVQIWIDNAKQGGKDIISGMDNSRDAIFFTEYVYYSDLVSSGKALDITEIATQKLTKFGENKSIADKFTDEQKNYLITKNDKIYMLPHYQGFRGITYDIDLFESELLYLSADKNNGNDGFIIDMDETMSKGPDGVAGTYDDGLPATYDEFFALCSKMKDLGITPVIWTGSNPVYFTEFLASLACDYEGLEQSMLNFTFDGTAKNLVSSATESGITMMGDTAITPNNGYLLAKQAGKYYALQFADRLLNKSSKYIDLRSVGALSHTEAQKTYIASRFLSTESTIGMLIESNYWENEADDMGYFKTMAKQYGEDRASRNARRFGFMPFPKATQDKVGEGVTLVDYLMTGAFIRGNVGQETGKEYEKALALDFLQFLYTDESLVEFTLYTGCPKSLNYNVDSIMDKVSPYTRSVFEMRARADIVYPYCDKDIYVDNASNLNYANFYKTVVNKGQGNTPYQYPSNTIYKDGVTGLEYFNGLSVQFSKEYWDNAYSRYYI